jgi:hypothetical protein
MTPKLLFSILLLCIFFACKHKIEEQNIPIDYEASNFPSPTIFACETGPRISLNSPEIGQFNRYIAFKSMNDSINHQYGMVYLPDTLIVEIVGHDDTGFVFKEYFTAGSDPTKISPNSFSFENEAKTWHGYADLQDTFYITQPGIYSPTNSLLFFGRHPNLSLSKVNFNFQKIRGWSIDQFPIIAVDKMYYAENTLIRGLFYPHLNIFVQNKSAQLDVPGALYFYDHNCTMVRTVQLGEFGLRIGFDLIQ